MDSLITEDDIAHTCWAEPSSSDFCSRIQTSWVKRHPLATAAQADVATHSESATTVILLDDDDSDEDTIDAPGLADLPGVADPAAIFRSGVHAIGLGGLWAHRSPHPATRPFFSSGPTLPSLQPSAPLGDYVAVLVLCHFEVLERRIQETTGVGLPSAAKTIKEVLCNSRTPFIIAALAGLCGDFLWIAAPRGIKPFAGEAIEARETSFWERCFMTGFVVERKTPEDVYSSVYDKDDPGASDPKRFSPHRFSHQKRALLRCGLTRTIMLLEGHHNHTIIMNKVNADVEGTIRRAFAVSLVQGFAVVHPGVGASDTARWLSWMTCAIGTQVAMRSDWRTPGTRDIGRAASSSSVAAAAFQPGAPSLSFQSWSIFIRELQSALLPEKRKQKDKYGPAEAPTQAWRAEAARLVRYYQPALASLLASFPVRTDLVEALSTARGAPQVLVRESVGSGFGALHLHFPSSMAVHVAESITGQRQGHPVASAPCPYIYSIHLAMTPDLATFSRGAASGAESSASPQSSSKRARFSDDVYVPVDIARGAASSSSSAAGEGGREFDVPSVLHDRLVESGAFKVKSRLDPAPALSLGTLHSARLGNKSIIAWCRSSSAGAMASSSSSAAASGSSGKQPITQWEPLVLSFVQGSTIVDLLRKGAHSIVANGNSPGSSLSSRWSGGALSSLLHWCEQDISCVSRALELAAPRVIFVVIGLSKAVAAAQAQRNNDYKPRTAEQRSSRFSPTTLAERAIRIRADGVRNALAHAFVLAEVEFAEFETEEDAAPWVLEVTKALQLAPYRLLVGGK